MIVHWTENCLKVIPSNNGNIVKLLPGNNEVETPQWESARLNVLDEIQAGRIIEKHTVVEAVTIGKGDSKESVETIVPKDFSELTAKEALEIVKQTNGLDTLNAWLDIESRDSVRAGILKQIKNTEEYDPTKD